MKIITAIAFILILLIQSTGLTFGTHYCGGKAVSHSLMVAMLSDMSCGMASESYFCDQHQGKEGISKMNCCQDELLTLSTDEEFSGSSSTLVPSDTLEFSSVELHDLDYTAPTPYSADYSKYAPPLIGLDRQILFEVFRI